jgi:hypothetical protein
MQHDASSTCLTLAEGALPAWTMKLHPRLNDATTTRTS